MKSVRLLLLIVLGIFILYVKLTTTGTSSSAPATSPASAVTGVPGKAVQVLQIVRQTGEPPPGYVGGRTFDNREGHLPSDGDYREFDVDPHNGQRNAERLIVEWKTKKAWYTGDHYQTFIPVP